MTVMDFELIRMLAGASILAAWLVGMKCLLNSHYRRTGVDPKSYQMRVLFPYAWFNPREWVLSGIFAVATLALILLILRM